MDIPPLSTLTQERRKRWKNTQQLWRPAVSSSILHLLRAASATFTTSNLFRPWLWAAVPGVATPYPVSYTHLDVYKRQPFVSPSRNFITISCVSLGATLESTEITPSPPSERIGSTWSSCLLYTSMSYRYSVKYCSQSISSMSEILLWQCASVPTSWFLKQSCRINFLISRRRKEA